MRTIASHKIKTLLNKSKLITQRLRLLAASLVMAGSAVTSLVLPLPASAATGNISAPFDIGTTWHVCQGYNSGVSHTGTSLYGLDLTGGPSCDNSADGRNVRASVGGTIQSWSTGTGTLCINTAGNKSYALTHIDASVTSGTVTAGQVVGTVAAAGQRANNGVAHLHFQMWTSPNCYNSSTMPFDAAHSARICGAPDMDSGGPGPISGTTGTWGGTQFTAASCGHFAAFNSGNLWYTTDTTTVNTGLGMASGTSPSVATLSNGDRIIAFQSNAGQLWVTGTGGVSTQNLGYGMASGTSPSITALNSGNWQIAFQSNAGQLWVAGASGTGNTGLGMVAGTSPSITKLSGGAYQVAFNSGNLWLYGYVTSNTGFGMATGTSPSITAVGTNGYEVAMNSGNLWVYGTAATANSGLSMSAGTSPSITTLANGSWQAAFNSGNLWLYGNTASGDTGYGMTSGTSPSITKVSNGFEVAFNSGNLWLVGDAVNTNTGLGMTSGTGPAITQ